MFGKKKVENDNTPLSNANPEQSSNDIPEKTSNEVPEKAPREVRDIRVNAMNLKAPKIIKPSIVSEGFEFTGDINKPDGPLNVDGILSGTINVDSLSIGVNGVVDGVITARSIIVKGKLSGQICCSEILVGGFSVVEGELTYSSITIQRGGVLKGELRKVRPTTQHPGHHDMSDVPTLMPDVFVDMKVESSLDTSDGLGPDTK